MTATVREPTQYDGFVVEYLPNSHRYAIVENDVRTAVPSVTGVLKVLDKPALLMWAERAGAEGAAMLARQGELDGVPIEETIQRVRLFNLGMDAKRQEGADRGTLVHRVLEVWSTEGTVPSLGDFEPELRGYVQGLCGWLLKVEPQPIAVETVVASRLHGFAGRFDLLATIDDQTVLVDLKTSPGARTYLEAHLQTAAYELALVECGFGFPDDSVLVAVGEDGTFNETGCDATGDDFLAVFEAYAVMGRLRKLADVCRKLEPIAKKHDAFVASSEFQHTPRTALRAARETQRLSRREVAIRAGMTERNLAALEGGSQRPWLPNAVALGRALAIPIEELWPETFAPALNDHERVASSPVGRVAGRAAVSES